MTKSLRLLFDTGLVTNWNSICKKFGWERGFTSPMDLGKCTQRGPLYGHQHP
jgi:hypothetical protein